MEKRVGIDLECLNSYADCTSFLRRHPILTSKPDPTGLFLSGVPAGILAEDVLAILSRDRNNLAAFSHIALAVVLPPIPQARPPLGYRLLILTSLNSNWFTLDFFLLKRTLLKSYKDKPWKKITTRLNKICNTPFRRPSSK
jgi:hypothetical protein